MFVQAFELNGAFLDTWACALSPRSGLCWLDGAASHGETGRYSFVGCDPVETRVTYAGDALPCDVLNDLAARRQAPVTITDDLTTAHVPRWAGYVAYDATWTRADVTPQRHQRAHDPILWFARYDAWLVLDHRIQRAALVGDDDAACTRLRQKLLAAPVRPTANAGTVHASDPTAHAHAIEQALEQVARGQLYQVNLARTFDTEISGDPLALYLAMRAQGDVPLGMYLDAGGQQVLCRSMETFVRWDSVSRSLETRPIKGTIARSGQHDATEATALRQDDKERAEHTMIVDLMRNDLGRVAEVGSVRPVEVMRVEPYAGLSHLVSTVACRTRADVTLGQIFDATFPPGSVTGTPKLAAIAHIETLEVTPRGIYTGAVGYVDQAGGCRFAVAIRTAVVRDGHARYFAGGGIVDGSHSGREVAETELKARVFADAIAALRER